MKEIILVGESAHTIKASSLNEALQLAFEVSEDKRIFDNHGSMRGILGNLFGAKKSASPMQGGYDSSLRIEMGDTPFNTAAKVYALAQVAAGVTARIWEFPVPPRFMYVWGWGAYGVINNQGYMWLALLKAATGFQRDQITLAVESYDRHNFVPVKEFLDDASHLADFTTLATATPTNNQTGMLALPQTTVIAMPYSRLAINAKVIVAQAAMDAAGFQIPVTVKSS